MATGMIIELSINKGYGFLKEDQTGRIIRFDINGKEDDFQLSQPIEFNIIDLEPGKLAINLRPSSHTNRY